MRWPLLAGFRVPKVFFPAPRQQADMPICRPPGNAGGAPDYRAALPFLPHFHIVPVRTVVDRSLGTEGQEHPGADALGQGWRGLRLPFLPLFSPDGRSRHGLRRNKDEHELAITLAMGRGCDAWHGCGGVHAGLADAEACGAERGLAAKRQRSTIGRAGSVVKSPQSLSFPVMSRHHFWREHARGTLRIASDSERDDGGWSSRQ